MLPRWTSPLSLNAKHRMELVVVNCRENGPRPDRHCLTFLQICPNLHQEGADGMQPPSSRVLSASLFNIHQVGVVTDTHRNIEVSWKEGRWVLCLEVLTWLRRKFWNVATVNSKKGGRNKMTTLETKTHYSCPACLYLNNRIGRVGDIFWFQEIALLWRLKAAHSAQRWQHCRWVGGVPPTSSFYLLPAQHCLLNLSFCALSATVLLIFHPGTIRAIF